MLEEKTKTRRIEIYSYANYFFCFCKPIWLPVTGANTLYRVYVRGHKYVLGPTQTHLKMSSGKGPKQFYSQEHKLYYYFYHFGRHWENEKLRKTNLTTKQRAFTTWMVFIFPQRKYTIELSWLQECNGFLIFIGFLNRTIIWFTLFIGLFQQAKMHFSPPSSLF